MSLFRWKPEYAVGIKIIDEQHQVLVQLINQLHDAIEDHFRTISLENILQQLFDYTHYHFTTEEELMVRYNYQPDQFEKHKKQHKQFIAELNSSQADLDNLTREDAALIQEFLVNWLKSHILKVDTQLAEFLLNHSSVHDFKPSIQGSHTSERQPNTQDKELNQQLLPLLNQLKHDLYTLPTDTPIGDKKNQLIQQIEELTDLYNNRRK